MLNVSRMPTIRPGSHELMRVEPDLETLATSKKTNLGVSWDSKDLFQPSKALEYEDLLEGVFTGLKRRKS